MIKNRISKYFSEAAAESQVQPEPPKVNPSAFVAMPLGGAMPGPAMPGGIPPAPMGIYEIALAEAQRKIAAERAKELDDLSGWFDENS